MADEKKGPQTYYLREGKTHHIALKGEAVELNRFGDTAELSDEQYKSFKDKFLTESEYKAQKAGKDAAEGATAADTLLRERASSATPEEANAAGNTPSGESSASGEISKVAATKKSTADQVSKAPQA